MQGSSRASGSLLGTVRIMIGPNVVVPRAAIVAAVMPDGPLPSIDGDVLHERLSTIVDELGVVPPPWRGTGSASAETLALLVAWLAVVLQNACGGRVCDHAVGRGLDGTIHAACAYQNGVVGRAAMMVAGRLVAAALAPAWPDRPSSLRTAVANVLELGRRAHDDQHTRVVVERAALRGIPAYRVVPDYAVMQLGQGAMQHNFLRVMGSRFEHVGSMLCDKRRSHAVLERLGIPVARQSVVASPEAAQRAAKEMGGAVVLKPSFGHSGLGVTVGISDPEQIVRAYRKAEAANAGSILLESFEAGDDFRLLLVDGKLIAAARRIPAHVVGNGRDPIVALVAEVNRDPRRGSEDKGDLVRLVLDEEAGRLLAQRGYHRDSIPADGEVVFLRATANVSTGGTAEDVTDKVHPAVRQMAEVIARAFRLEILGIDYLASDIALSPERAGGVVCEVNRSPGLRPHPPAVQAAVLDLLLDRYFGIGNGRIPVAMITGTSGKTTTSKMVAAMLEANGVVTGLASSRGVAVGGRTLQEGDSVGGFRAQMALFDPMAEAAVLEIGRGGILRHGLPVDWADVAAVLNIGHDHLGQDGLRSLDDVARAKSVVAAAGRRAVVLNADDDRCRALAPLATAPIVWTSTSAGNAAVAAHVRAGGTAVYVEGDGDARRIVHDRGGERRIVAALDAIPAALGGVVEANLGNAVAAVAIGCSLGVPFPAIAAGLARVAARFTDNPGRFNLLRAGPAHVLVDAASCREDVAALRAAVGRLPPFPRRVLALTHAGNYPDANIRALAEAAAGGFDAYVCYDWDERRGRASGAVAGLLADALLATGLPDSSVSVIPDQRQAVGRCMELAGVDGLAILIMQDEPEALEDTLRSAGVDGWEFATVSDWLAGRAIAPLVNDAMQG